jgi:large subunit ribosomal protein L14e
VDLLDQNRVLIEGPGMGVKRQVMSVKRIALTTIKLEGLKRGATGAEVKAAYDAANVEASFAASGWGKKLDRKAKRAALTDFGRFKVMVARMAKSKAVDAELKKLQAA